jgi:hypothetical protein
MARIVVEAAGVVVDEEHAAQAQPQCEVKQFLDGRFFGSAEAAWRLLGFDLHSRQPPVQRLAVHLPGQQSIAFEEDQNLSDVLDKGPGTTTLTAWFAFAEAEQQRYQQQLSEARRLHPDIDIDAEVPMPEALTVTYQESPMVATWNPAKKQWTARKNKRKFPTIGRIEYVSPSQPELYYLRVLLAQVKGATSFHDLLTTNKGTAQEVVHGSFKDACVARGLLERDDEWHDCMEEAKSCASPRQIRALFATILAFNSVANPLELWNTFRDAMAEDFLYDLRRQLQDPERPYDDTIYGKALRALEQLLRGMGNYDLATFNLPHPGSIPDDPLSEQELARYERNAQAAIRDRCAPALNDEQRRIYTTVMEAVRHSVGKTIFVDGVGGAGKTYLYSTILAAVRAEGRIALPVASSGIAALLLEGGRTAHSRFKIPVKGLHGESRCFVHREDDLAKLIIIIIIITQFKVTDTSY